jgi:addiction module RelE/StbE family toxin
VKVRWSLAAVDELTAIREYIARDNPSAAFRVAMKILDSVDRLERCPGSGRIGRLANSRELVISGLPYIAIYRIVDDVVDVSAVIHASRRWPEKL